MPATRRAAAFIVLAALIAASCSGSVSVDQPEANDAQPTTTPDAGSGPAADPTPVEESQTGDTPTPVPTPFAPGDAEPLPVDPDVTVGRLDNGLTYYIRHNEAPGGRAELRLAVNAGSALEDPDQSGVAHFLEHMLFNGTERYPSNDLIEVLEGFGSEFGPDVNAFTSYDETVYELSIPTDTEALVVEAFDVLREWASNATIDPAEVEAERGVVVEEWRLRGQGLGGRIGDLYDELLTTGTPYEARAPIGEVDALRNMTADVLRRFYEDWYRPDLMAVVVVGDLDVARVEALIESAFGDMAGPTDPRPRPEIEIGPNRERAFRRLEDPEMPFAYVELIAAGLQSPTLTLGDYRRTLAYELAAEAMRNRFDDDVARGEAPYLRAYPSTTPIARRLATPGLLAEASADAIEVSFESLLIEMERIRRDGLTEAEFERVRDSFQTSAEQAFAGRGTTQDVDYAAEYVDAFLARSPMLSWDDFLDLETRLLAEITPEYAAAVFLEAFDASEPEVVIVAPSSTADALPADAQLAAVLDEMPGTDVDARVDESRDLDTLMQRPEPAAIVARDTNQVLESQVLRFANGATVLLKTTAIAESEFILQAMSPGGYSVLDEDELAAALLAGDVVTQSGVGSVDQVELSRLLADQSVSVGFSASDVDEYIFGSGSADDAETLLQLVNQYVTAPQAEASALDTAVTELEPLAADPDLIPAFAANNELRRARYGDGRRFQLLPTTDELNSLDTDDISDVFITMYGDASDLTLAIVGDFEIDPMVDLVASYVGTLPGDGNDDPWVDHQGPPPPGIVRRTVEAGQDDQGSITMLITAEEGSDERRNIELRVLENVLSARLRDQLRERLGATYSPRTTVAAVERPDLLIETTIEVGGDPERLDEIIDEVRLVLADLRSGGLGEAEVAAAAEQVRRDLELVSNSFWAEQMLYAEAHPEVTMLSIDQRVAVAADITAGAVQALIDAVLLDDQFIVVSLGPA